MIATFIRSESSSPSFFGGRLSYILSKRSPIPIAFAAEIAYGSPRPKL